MREEILSEERQLKAGARKAGGQDWKDCLPGQGGKGEALGGKARRASSEVGLAL